MHHRHLHANYWTLNHYNWGLKYKFSISLKDTERKQMIIFSLNFIEGCKFWKQVPWKCKEAPYYTKVHIRNSYLNSKLCTFCNIAFSLYEAQISKIIGILFGDTLQYNAAVNIAYSSWGYLPSLWHPKELYKSSS